MEKRLTAAAGHGQCLPGSGCCCSRCAGGYFVVGFAFGSILEGEEKIIYNDARDFGSAKRGKIQRHHGVKCF